MTEVLRPRQFGWLIFTHTRGYLDFRRNRRGTVETAEEALVFDFVNY